MNIWVEEDGIWHLLNGATVFVIKADHQPKPLTGLKACGMPIGELSRVVGGDTPPSQGTWCGGCAEVAVFGRAD